MVHLRLSSQAVRSSWATAGLVDCDTGRVVEVFAYQADAARAKVALEQIGMGARELGGAAIHDLAAAACEQVYGHRQYDQLPLKDLTSLIKTVRSTLDRNPQ